MYLCGVSSQWSTEGARYQSGSAQRPSGSLPHRLVPGVHTAAIKFSPHYLETVTSQASVVQGGERKREERDGTGEGEQAWVGDTRVCLYVSVSFW